MIALRRPATLAAAIVASTLSSQTGWAESASDLPVAFRAPSYGSPLTLLPQAEALRVSLAQHGSPTDPVRSYYESRSYSPFWLAADGAATPSVTALLDWVRQAEDHALPAGRYNVDDLTARLSTPDARTPSEVAELETALTALYLTYARDISSGLLEPREISRNIDVKPQRPDPGTLLASLESADDMAAHLASLQPSDPGYAKLMTLYAELRALAAAGGWGQVIESGGTLRLGDRDLRIPQLRSRLNAIGELEATATAEAAPTKVASNEVMSDAKPASVGSDPEFFDPTLAAAVQRFQARHGLNTDGVVGPATLAALNTSVTERIAQTAVNLERMRWFQIEPTGRHILINTADFSMQLVEDSVSRFKTRTVVGKARRFQTPEFNDRLEYMVVNPYWNVPYSIATKEILPLLKENPDYLVENNMELLGSDLPASQIDWTTVTRGSFPGRLRQRPGPGNALGFVKFLFPNNYSVYMHDTPQRKLFAHDQRDYSHGCVRLERPYDFAHLLLSLQPEVTDPVARFEHLRSKFGEQWIRLYEPIPVYLTYRTVWLDPDGTRQFRADVYRRDRAMAEALAAAGVPLGG